MQSDNSKSWFQKLNERIDSEPRPSDEAVARIRAEREAIHEAMEGTSKETAFMGEDRAVTVKYWTFKDRVVGDGWDLVSPTDDHYQEICTRHHLKNPGDSNTITMMWIGGAWQEAVQLKLVRGTELVGTITNLDSDWPWMGGQIKLTPAAQPYKHFWDFWTIEGNREKEPPFDIPEDIDENWYIEDEKGVRLHIEFPAVHNDGTVWWREYF